MIIFETKVTWKKKYAKNENLLFHIHYFSFVEKKHTFHTFPCSATRFAIPASYFCNTLNHTWHENCEKKEAAPLCRRLPFRV
jgi:hypothetical protein